MVSPQAGQRLVSPQAVSGPCGAGVSFSTAGASYYPTEKVAFKGDIEHWKDGTGAKVDRVNLGAAFMF